MIGFTIHRLITAITDTDEKTGINKDTKCKAEPRHRKQNIELIAPQEKVQQQHLQNIQVRVALG